MRVIPMGAGGLPHFERLRRIRAVRRRRRHGNREIVEVRLALLKLRPDRVDVDHYIISMSIRRYVSAVIMHVGQVIAVETGWGGVGPRINGFWSVRYGIENAGHVA